MFSPDKDRAMSRRWLSLRYRLPVFIGALVLGTVTAFAWSGYRVLERTLVTVAEQRLANATDQLRRLLVRGARQLTEQLAARADTAAFAAYAAAPADAGARASARAALTRLAGSATQALSVAVWLPAPGARLAARTRLADSLGARPAAGAGKPVAGVGPLGDGGGFGYYDVAVPIRGPGGKRRARTWWSGGCWRTGRARRR